MLEKAVTKEDHEKLGYVIPNLSYKGSNKAYGFKVVLNRIYPDLILWSIKHVSSNYSLIFYLIKLR